MQTLMIQFSKGGSGKTCTAFLLAVELMKQKHAVGVVDIDPQQSLTRKMKKRGDIPCLSATFTTLEKVIDKGKAAGLDYLIVDTPPHSGVQFKTITPLADLVIAPINNTVVSDASITDEVKAVLPANKTVLFLNDISVKGQAAAMDYLRKAAPEYKILKSRIYTSDAIRNKYAEAKSPSDMRSWMYDKATSQIKAFAKEVKKWASK